MVSRGFSGGGEGEGGGRGNRTGAGERVGKGQGELLLSWGVEQGTDGGREEQNETGLENRRGSEAENERERGRGGEEKDA